MAETKLTALTAPEVPQDEMLVLPVDLALACVQYIAANPGPIATLLLNELKPHVARQFPERVVE